MNVMVIGYDLGRPGASIEGRHGLQRLVAEGLGKAGIVIGLEGVPPCPQQHGFALFRGPVMD